MTQLTTTLQIHPQMQQCIEECLECHGVCLQTAVSYCVPTGGKQAEPVYIRVILDCAELCQTCANFLLRGSDLHPRICGICADLCDRCAADCEQIKDDAQMKACAEVCRRCASSCRNMAMAIA